MMKDYEIYGLTL